jgi:carboxypeptidase Q
MIQQGQEVKVSFDLKVDFAADAPTYNTVAEIPGTDLKDEIVMAGAHLDSWQAGTGATDNGTGSAAVMEASRIISALHLRPRRTIRFALWTGEEEGLLGSRAYVKSHFGYMQEPPRSAADDAATEPATRPTGVLVKGPEYETLSVYFNIDTGTGKIRGVSAQSNPKAAVILRQFIAPFNDLGAATVTLGNMASTDHVSFDTVGLPAFSFVQDAIEYGTRTHHSNEDVYDRIQPEDIKQAATVLAAFLWQAANMEEKFPRKAGM